MKNYIDIKDFYNLFEAVQQAEIFEDQKTMVDAIPLFPIAEIETKYEEEKNHIDFDLKDFVLRNFFLEKLSEKGNDISADKLPIKEHIKKLWNQLTKTAYEERGTLLGLPKPYIVPGGRFIEFFYWDSYFVMLGLQVSGNIEMMKNIVENCSYLIMNYGFVPNASRSYFLTRSQPPYFSLMLDLIYESTNDEKIYLQYFETLEKEYQFWMSGEENLEFGQSYKRVLKTNDGDILNRYYDDENLPRPESYLIDVKDFKTSENREFYRNIRAACESGWDFSSRWFADGESIKTINTLELAQIDLNSLLWNLENTLAKASRIKENLALEKKYQSLADQRLSNIEKYFWDKESKIYRDFNFLKNEQTSSEHIASLYPLFLGFSNMQQALDMKYWVSKKFLHPGGLVTTTKQTGEQWDFPNAWAPNQWIGYTAMKKYGFDDVADEIKTNWSKNVERVYNNVGKLMEKYNAVDVKTIAGGGEYPNQDGFGWTNGVYLKINN
ncbi:trehalase family glycosidase [Epilithonimonas sp.]|uniref:trehalase family glycosidase n=1 Tax=Epilithonimonas sp. TaxID=2894511 RepID=UPI0028A2B08D|nr:trehalase family glycosidase [Epilithonimonas sp.]